MMTLHQVNGDGAGPYACMIDSTGAGTQWTTMQVATNVPGEDSRSKAKATDFVSNPSTRFINTSLTCTTASYRQGRSGPDMYWNYGRHAECLHGQMCKRRQRRSLWRLRTSTNGERQLHNSRSRRSPKSDTPIPRMSRAATTYLLLAHFVLLPNSAFFLSFKAPLPCLSPILGASDVAYRSDPQLDVVIVL